MEVKEEELNVLFQALVNVKFPIDDDKLFDLAGSGVLVNILTNVMTQMNLPQEFNIEDFPERLDYVKTLMSSKKEIKHIPLDSKKELVRNLLFPFNSKEETILDLLGEK